MLAAEDEDIAQVFVSAERPEVGQANPNLYVLSPFGVQPYRRSLEPWTIVPHAIYPPSGAWA